MQTEIPNISVHSHPSKFVLKPSWDKKGGGNSAITLNSSQLAEYEVLMPLSMALCFWQVFSKRRFYCWEGETEIKRFQKCTAHRFTACWSVFIAHICFVTTSLFSMYLPRTEKRYSLGHIIHQSKLFYRAHCSLVVGLTLYFSFKFCICMLCGPVLLFH